MHCADTNTGHKGDNSFGNHREVNSNGVALTDAHLLENPSSPRDFSKEFTVCNIATFAGLISLIDDGNTIRVLKSVTVDTIVRGVQATLVKV
jgi:hypothetical protein